MKIIDVLTEYGKRSLDHTFSYAYFGKKRIEPRFRVRISFGAQEAVMGFVLAVRDTEKTLAELEEENGYAFKEIHDYDIIDEEPLVDDKMMELANRVSKYYLAPFIGVLQAMLPLSLSPKTSALRGPKIAYEQWVELVKNDENDLTDKQIEMLRLVAANTPILKKECGSIAILKKLLEKGRV
ncbi:MAG: hypothetical protein J5627_04100, partial [Bacilli bacterium]|nr:hypothetical protein [Bacilli bacterium]